MQQEYGHKHAICSNNSYRRNHGNVMECQSQVLEMLWKALKTAALMRTLSNIPESLS